MQTADVAAYVAQWRPSSVSPQAAAFARDVIAAAEPHDRERAKNLLWAAGRLADYAASLGLDLVPETVFRPSVLERFARRAWPVGGGAADAAHQPAVHRPPRGPAAVSGGCAAAPGAGQGPYSPAEIGGFLALAGAQPTAERRMRATGLVCLGAGAGLIRADLRDVRGSDVLRRSGGVVVQVRGPRGRVVPVLARYHAPLLAAARSAGDGLVVGGADPGRRNLTNPPVAALDGGAGLPRLDTSRLRATWLAEVAGLLGLATFMHAAGISCSQRLGDLAAG